MSVEEVEKVHGKGANAKTHLIGCGENAATKSVQSTFEAKQRALGTDKNAPRKCFNITDTVDYNSDYDSAIAT